MTELWHTTILELLLTGAFFALFAIACCILNSSYNQSEDEDDDRD